MNEFHWLLLWIGSVLLATVVGYDRGRWAMGLTFGLLFGPLGALATGLLTPSPEVEARRRYQVDRQLSLLKRSLAARVKERRDEAAALASAVTAIEEDMKNRRPTLGEGLSDLAGELEQLTRADPAREPDLRNWIEWLNEHSGLVRSRDEPADDGFL